MYDPPKIPSRRKKPKTPKLAVVRPVAAAAAVTTAPAEAPRYIIAHRCNSVRDIAKALENGANGLECDVRYHQRSKSWYVDHDGVFPWSTKLDDWLQEAKK